MKFKKGDMVRVKEDLTTYTRSGYAVFTYAMYKYMGELHIIHSVKFKGESITLKGIPSLRWSPQWLEPMNYLRAITELLAD